MAPLQQRLDRARDGRITGSTWLDVALITAAGIAAGAAAGYVYYTLARETPAPASRWVPAADRVRDRLADRRFLASIAPEHCLHAHPDQRALTQILTAAAALTAAQARQVTAAQYHDGAWIPGPAWDRLMQSGTWRTWFTLLQHAEATLPGSRYTAALPALLAVAHRHAGLMSEDDYHLLTDAWAHHVAPVPALT